LRNSVRKHKKTVNKVKLNFSSLLKLFGFEKLDNVMDRILYSGNNSEESKHNIINFLRKSYNFLKIIVWRV